MIFALACLVAAVVLALSGCAPLAPAEPVTTITFLSTSAPDKTGSIIEIDMTFAPDVQIKGGTVYPHEWIHNGGPFSHHQIAGKGTVTSYIFKVHAIEPGQKVTCVILFNGNAAKPVDTHTATFPKPAVCSGPPV